MRYLDSTPHVIVELNTTAPFGWVGGVNGDRIKARMHSHDTYTWNWMLYPVASRIAGSFNRVWARACWLLATAVQAARPLSLPFSGACFSRESLCSRTARRQRCARGLGQSAFHAQTVRRLLRSSRIPFCHVLISVGSRLFRGAS